MTPILYSFRRCPYAIRARLALASSGQTVALREILLREKPSQFLAASPSATVPCLVTDSGVIDESLDVMVWALGHADPEHWLSMPDQGWDWIKRSDGPFKDALDKTKYHTRYPETNTGEQRQIASAFIAGLETQLDGYLFAEPTLADYAILPFVRQFAFIDKPWFDAQPWPKVQSWLDRFLASDRFAKVMLKYPVWQEGDGGVTFP